MTLWPTVLKGKLCFVLGHLADLAATGHPQQGEGQSAPISALRDSAHAMPAPCCSSWSSTTSDARQSPPHPQGPHPSAHAQEGLFPKPAEVGSRCCVWPLDPCHLPDSPRPHHLHPKLNSLSGPVPLAPAPGCLLLALRACLYVLAVAEFWGGQTSPSWRPSKGLVAETLGENPKARRYHTRLWGL